MCPIPLFRVIYGTVGCLHDIQEVSNSPITILLYHWTRCCPYTLGCGNKVIILCHGAHAEHIMLILYIRGSMHALNQRAIN